MSRWPVFSYALAALLCLGVAACATSTNTSSPGSSSGAGTVVNVNVAASINAWGSILAQLGGSHVHEKSIITNPDTDPHAYEPTPADGRTIADSRLFVENGIGYDPWAAQALAASPDSSRLVLDVGHLVNVAKGGNPHRWYSPSNVETVADAITADLKKLDPKHASYYDQRHAEFENQELATYHRLIADIKARYGGTPVGASESIFALQAPALGLNLTTPYSFLKAISEGTEVSAQDTLTVERQLSDHEVKVWIYNSQNATPEIQRLNALARAEHIPIATITETLTPPQDSYQAWQDRQLRGIEAALAASSRTAAARTAAARTKANR